MATFGVDPIPATAVCARDPGSRRRDHSSLVGGDLARFSPQTSAASANLAVSPPVAPIAARWPARWSRGARTAADPTPSGDEGAHSVAP